ncbi:TetR/AcrR family transcriptional regulator [Streptomyces sp. YS415]|uniref:TetR/AcrR family transcriptional regulator n=1 Tax=Streptomyces sp. YS415 TaxID=2944806 RepID=UPI0020224ACF|nr:TetR/AcrR family transcriptional regulator [Streptomyces sp. YS415]MCL7430179.1 TetR/AcrR family transcriptional regulator [Streptomyces sp. YS415]
MTGRRAEARRRNREALITAAERLFTAHGYRDVGVHAVAQAADLTSGAIYSIFGSKLDLLLAVLDRRLDGLDAALAEVDGDRTTTATAVVATYAEEFHRVVTSRDGRSALRLEVDVLAVVLRDEDGTADRLRLAVRREERLASVLTGRTVATDDDHRLTGDQASRLASAVCALLRGLAQQQALTGGATTPDRWADLAAALITPARRP